MFRSRRDDAIGPSEDPTSFDLVSGDTLKLEVPPRDAAGSAPASRAAGRTPRARSRLRERGGDPGRRRRPGRTPVGPLVREMIDAWRRGDCPAVEDLLACHPTSATMPGPSSG